MGWRKLEEGVQVRRGGLRLVVYIKYSLCLCAGREERMDESVENKHERSGRVWREMNAKRGMRNGVKIEGVE